MGRSGSESEGGREEILTGCNLRGGLLNVFAEASVSWMRMMMIFFELINFILWVAARDSR